MVLLGFGIAVVCLAVFGLLLAWAADARGGERERKAEAPSREE